MSNPAIVSNSTRAAVEAAIAETGYTLNVAARNLRQSQVGGVLALVPKLANPFFSVILSGIAELALGASLLVLRQHRALVGWVVAAFFVAIFPGNISQFVDGDKAFGLDSDVGRGIRLLFQPVLVVWALWCTGAWAAWRRR